MFPASSRYHGIPTATTTFTAPDGSEREVTFVRRRLLPHPADFTKLADHEVAAGERLDHVAARYLGDATQFWRILDATDVRRPSDVETTGYHLPIAMPLTTPPTPEV